jgi:hypothetical protein
MSEQQTSTAVLCDCCGRMVRYVRGSMWHGRDRICLACFYVWYDPDGAIDVTKPEQIKAAVLKAEAAGTYPFGKHVDPKVLRVEETDAP